LLPDWKVMTDIFDHMEEAWKLERNPFPAEGDPPPECGRALQP
jgi:hypothetical protein